MKNVINYYYNLFPIDIHQKDKKFFFEVEQKKYVFTPYQNDISRLEKVEYIIKSLEYYHINYNQIIRNNANSIVTYVSNIPYILIKVNIDNYNNVILSDLNDFFLYTKDVISNKLDLKNLSSLWMDKVDYFEYQISQFGIKFPIIRHSFNYFIGLAENGIIVLNDILKDEILGTLSHYRVSLNSTLSELYNPLTLVIDSKVRDISEYLKEKMFFVDISEEVIYYFKYTYLSNSEAVLFLARLLFPTYYFDICEKCILKNDEEELKILISKISIYESNLKYIYRFLKNNYRLPEIEWLLI